LASGIENVFTKCNEKRGIVKTIFFTEFYWSEYIKICTSLLVASSFNVCSISTEKKETYILGSWLGLLVYKKIMKFHSPLTTLNFYTFAKCYVTAKEKSKHYKMHNYVWIIMHG
jgi:hypothetical protein